MDRRPRKPLALRRHFWLLIGQGVSTEQAAIRIGVSEQCGKIWFRDGGGMPPLALTEPSGRYLSFAEREEIALG